MITPSELVFAVDEHDVPIDPLPRDYTHKHGIWHRISHVWVTNDKKQILCQQRSTAKDTNPGKWEAFFGGHVGSQESYEEGAVKEVNEELGHSFGQKDLHFFAKAKNDKSKHFQSAYYVLWNGSLSDLSVEKEEVEQVVWKDISEVENILLVQNDQNWVHVAYEEEMLHALKKQ